MMAKIKNLILMTLVMGLSSNLVYGQASRILTNRSGNEMLDSWLDNGKYVALGILAIAVALFLFTIVEKVIKSEPKEKYDYINNSQKRLYMWTADLLVLAFCVYMTATVLGGKFIWVYYTAQVGVAVIFSGMLIFALKFTFQFYYPIMVEKRLKKLRYQPRYDSNGHEMTLLSEDEEDDYLDEGMQAEENAFSVDYDVWISKASGEVKIEKYDGYLHSEKCPSCGYQTYQLVKEELVKKPTASREGKAYKYYSCSYCGHKGKRAHRIHPTHTKLRSKMSEDSSQ
ncbi:MAG: hypothetical protein RID05_10465 [Cytophagales bacterium]